MDSTGDEDNNEMVETETDIDMANTTPKEIKIEPGTDKINTNSSPISHLSIYKCIFMLLFILFDAELAHIISK